MQVIMDKFINALKWPLAVYMLICLPACFEAFSYFQYTQLRYVALIAGFFLFFISRSMMDAAVKVNMEIVAHELTHAVFALITFHKVNGLKIEGDNSGGSMSFEGEGNWLIVIAPYFFPLFASIYMVVVSFLNPSYSTGLILSGVLGYFIGYHLDTVGSQIHEKQTDLPKVGYKFCAMFLPSANLLVVGAMLAFNSKGWDGIVTYWRLINYLNWKNFEYVINFIGI